MKRKTVLVAAVVVLLAAAAFFLWRGRRGAGGVSGTAPATAPRHVLLVTLDTIRADRIGAYGCSQARTPVLDALAAGGIRFSRAQSPVPLTLPAHASIITGTYPTFHRVRNNGSYRLPPQAETLAEILKRRGYLTAAFVSSFVLDSRFGLDQGFDVYSDRVNTGGNIKDLQSERSAGEVFADFDAWLASVDGTRPFFCWLHFYDPHLPYAPPEPFRSDPSLSPYDGEIANVDLNLGKAVERLRARGFYDDTLIVAAGDHGEGFGEHGESGHGIFCYQETLAVPLIFRIPGKPARTIDETVDLVDIMPTVLEALGENVPPHVQGVSLLPQISGKPGREREFYFESLYAQENMGGAPLIGLLAGGWKYIELPKAECYDLGADPGERNNLLPAEAARAGQIKTKLEGWEAENRERNVDAARTIGPEEKRRLESLGYISSGTARPEGSALPDPKDLIAAWTEHVAGKTFLDEGDLERAEEHLERAVELNPVFFNPYIDLARIRTGRGDIRGGLAVLKKGVDRNPGDAAIKIEYARALGEADRPGEALDILRQAESQMAYGQMETVQVMIGVTLSRLERYPEAAGRFRKALEIEPDNAAAARDLGYCLYRSGEFTEAVSFYKRAESAMPGDPMIPAELALCLAALKEYAAAAENFEKALRIAPSQEVFYNYGLMTAESGDLAKASGLMEKSLEQRPRDSRLAQKTSRLLQEWKNRLSLE